VNVLVSVMWYPVLGWLSAHGLFKVEATSRSSWVSTSSSTGSTVSATAPTSAPCLGDAAVLLVLAGTDLESAAVRDAHSI
jgi:hypothetical protein